MHTNTDRFSVALAAFKRATAELSEAWDDTAAPSAIEPYPAYLPSFDEFVADVLSMERTLEPGATVEFANGYVGRSYRETDSYYAERTGDELSPEFATFAQAATWLAREVS